MRSFPSVALFSIVLLGGCRASIESTGATPPPPNRDTQPRAIRSEVDELTDLAREVRLAPDAIAEGAALKRLQAWQAEHGTTFTLDAVRVDADTRVVDPSTSGERLRAGITIYRGQQPIYDFSFVPKDNRNLALLGH